VAEADESDRSFLRLSPILAVVTNIDREHMDCYRNMRDVKGAFLDFMDRVPFYGMVVACNDDPLLRRLLPQVGRRVVTYGTRRGSDFHIRLQDGERKTGEPGYVSCFHVTYRGQNLGEFRLHVPGVHNVLNAAAAIAVGIGLDIKADEIRTALESFRGVDRRFQLKGKAASVNVIDDYGHHPTEIRATLAAARQCGYAKIHVIFQPHRYSRTCDLMEEFANAFHDADTLFVLDIYAASEAPVEGVTGEALAEQIKDVGEQDARYVASFADAVESIAAVAQPGDMILTLGAGSVSQLGPMILEKLRAREAVDTPTSVV
jgi:UDP-N-acetylmuramate--alanine ligase